MPINLFVAGQLITGLLAPGGPVVRLPTVGKQFRHQNTSRPAIMPGRLCPFLTQKQNEEVDFMFTTTVDNRLPRIRSPDCPRLLQAKARLLV